MTIPGPMLVLAIDGLDGSGKSRFADALAAAFVREGVAATVVRVDDFKRPERLAGVAEADEADAYYQGYYDFDALDRRLDALAAEAGGAGLAIVEGVFVLRSRWAAAGALFVLEVDQDTAFARLRARDAAAGRAPAEIDRRIACRYRPAQNRYRAAFDPLGRAQLLIDNRDWGAPRVLKRTPRSLPPAVERALGQVLVSAA